MQQTYKGFILPTAEEEAEIQRGIELDPDTWNLSYEEFEQLTPVVLPMSEPAGALPPAT
ncbi:hypothetical protein AWB78_01614 [Caballeronia calidae]|uniref:Uncharacterized protein n=1 Tax=Caballeronia calidae TaxID=1777139 RepID=A0A158AGF5_9BURK|nr:hypothetical protein [Caballeronia calidae]SAK56799.1 hypothetical protein AWB78_01614 [Caballeronia calidae]